MSWARLDDSHLDHEKFLALDAALKPMQALAAYGLWCRCLTWSSKHLTDGYLPDAQVSASSRLRSDYLLPLVEALVNARGRQVHGLWVKVEGGYQIHDFTQWNRNKQEIEQFRATKVQAGREGGRRSGEARRQARASSTSQAPARTNEASAGHLRNSHPILTTKPPTPLKHVLEASASNNEPDDPFDTTPKDADPTDPAHLRFNIPD